MASISVRIEPKNINEVSGQTRHDLRLKIPSYVDRSRTDENSILIKPLDGKELLNECENIRKNQPKPPRALKKNCRVGISGIITFSSEAKTIIENIDRDKQNELFLQAGNKIAEFLNTDLTGLVIHRDESSVHCHFQCPAYNHKGFSLSNAIKPSDLSKLQDVASEVFLTYGITRGVKKTERIAAGEDYSKTIHRSVRQLHDDLPKELAELQAKIEKYQRLITQNEQKIAEGKGNLEKIEKNIEIYKKREADAKAKLEKLEAILDNENPPKPPQKQIIKEKTGLFASKEKEIIEPADFKEYDKKVSVWATKTFMESNEKKMQELQEKEKELQEREKELTENLKITKDYNQNYENLKKELAEKNELLTDIAKNILHDSGIETRNIYLEPRRATEIIKNYLVGGLEKVKEFWQKLQHSFSLSR